MISAHSVGVTVPLSSRAGHAPARRLLPGATSQTTNQPPWPGCLPGLHLGLLLAAACHPTAPQDHPGKTRHATPCTWPPAAKAQRPAPTPILLGAATLRQRTPVTCLPTERQQTLPIPTQDWNWCRPLASLCSATGRPGLRDPRRLHSRPSTCSSLTTGLGCCLSSSTSVCLSLLLCTVSGAPRAWLSVSDSPSISQSVSSLLHRPRTQPTQAQPTARPVCQSPSSPNPHRTATATERCISDLVVSRPTPLSGGGARRGTTAQQQQATSDPQRLPATGDDRPRNPPPFSIALCSRTKAHYPYLSSARVPVPVLLSPRVVP